MPNTLSGSWEADLRLPVALTFLLLASSQVKIASRQMTIVVAVVALCLLGARLWAVTQSWRDYDRQFAEFRAASRVIAAGSRLMVVANTIPNGEAGLAGVPRFFALRQSVAYFHMPELAVIDRSAFVPYVFTGWTTIAVARRNRDIAESVGAPATPGELRKGADPAERRALDARRNFFDERPYWRDWPEKFDYVLWMDFGSLPNNVPPQLVPVARGSFFQIFRVKRLVLRKPPGAAGAVERGRGFQRVPTWSR